MSLWIFDTESNGFATTMTRWHCHVYKSYKNPLWYVFTDRERWDERIKDAIQANYPSHTFHWGHIEDVKGFLLRPEVDMLSAHYMAGFDLPAMRNHLGISYSVADRGGDRPDTLMGKHVAFYDTLAMSRCLNPDRELPEGCPDSVYNPVTGRNDKIGAHSFAAWGYRVAKAKPAIHDWENDALVNYVNRCVEDVGIGERVWDCLKMEAQDAAKGSRGWKEALKSSQRSFFAMCQQEQEGAAFARNKAASLVERIDGMMGEIEEEVNNYFLERGEVRVLPTSQQPNYPKATIKKDGNLSNHAINWCVKFGIPEEEQFDTIMRINKALAEGETPLEEYVLTEPITISNQDAIKKYLVREGWKPTLWRVKNLCVDTATKRQHPEAVVNENVEGYIQEVKESPYLEFLLKELEWEGRTTQDALSTERFRKHVKSKARAVPTTPQIRDTFGKICENLEEMEGEFAKKIVKWLSMRNRRNVISSDKGTGWLHHPRLDKDGRLPASHSGLTNTHRVKHSVVVNVPKADPKVLLGFEMRDLFVSPENHYCLGWDSAALENRVAGHYAAKFDGGAYAELLLHGDSHTANAEAYSRAAGRVITRSSGKSVTYGCGVAH